VASFFQIRHTKSLLMESKHPIIRKMTPNHIVSLKGLPMVAGFPGMALRVGETLLRHVSILQIT
jgi:hypothetical protein